MKIALIAKRVAMAALIASVSVHAQAAETGQPAVGSKSIEFAGYATIGKEELFVLYDAAAKSASPWMRAGETWEGYTVMSFDRPAEKLVLGSGTSKLSLKLRESKAQPAVLLPTLIRGSYTMLDGTVIYSPDAQLRLGGGFLISSPSGLMVSDDKQTVVGGDLTVETDRTLVQAQNALVDTKKGSITANKMSITSPRKKEPNKAPDRISPSGPPPASSSAKPTEDRAQEPHH